jgi:drug/metabolite transporter, DME family
VSTSNGHTDVTGVAIVFGAAAALGTLGVISNLAYEAGMSAAVFTALRAALGAVILGTLVLIRFQPGTSIMALPSREKRLLLVAIVSNGSMNLLLFAGFQVMTVALVMTVFYTYPLMVMVVQAVRGQELITLTRVGALIVAMAGLVLVIGSQIGPEAHVSLAGVGLGLSAAVCQAAYLVVSRDGYPSVPAVQATSLVLMGGVLISGSAALLTGSAGTLGTWASEPVAWLAVIVAGTLGAAIPKVMLLVGVRRIGGTRTATVMLSEPVMAVAFAAIALGQEVVPAEIVGGAAILVGAALVQRPSRHDTADRSVGRADAAWAPRE